MYMLLHKVAGIMAEKNILAVILMHMVADKVAGMVSDMGDDKKFFLLFLSDMDNGHGGRQGGRQGGRHGGWSRVLVNSINFIGPKLFRPKPYPACTSCHLLSSANLFDKYNPFRVVFVFLFNNSNSKK